MITKTVFLASLDTGAFLLGYAGENEHIKYDIRCDSIFSDYPDATVSMLIKSPDGTVYPKVVTLDKPSVYWVVTASDTANDGNGQVQITFTNGDEVIKTVVASTVTMPSLFATGEEPDPIATWVDDADEILAKVTGMTATAEGLAAGSSPTATVTEVNGHYNIALGIPKGDKGDKGDTGAQGDPAPSNLVVPAVEDWLDENITNPSSPPLDSSLTLSNAAAPANLVGDLKGAFNNLGFEHINIFNKNNAITGYSYKTGTNNPELGQRQTSANDYVSTLISAKPSTKYSIRKLVNGVLAISSSGVRVVQYNSSATSTKVTWNSTATFDFTTESTTAFLSFSTSTANNPVADMILYESSMNPTMYYPYNVQTTNNWEQRIARLEGFDGYAKSKCRLLENAGKKFDVYGNCTAVANCSVQPSGITKFADKSAKVIFNSTGVQKLKIDVSTPSWESITIVMYSPETASWASTKGIRFRFGFNADNTINLTYWYPGSTFGWIYLKLPKSVFTSAPDYISSLYIYAEAGSDVPSNSDYTCVYFDSVIIDQRIKPTVILNFDQWHQDCIDNGAYEYAFANGIPFTTMTKNYDELNLDFVALAKKSNLLYGCENAYYASYGETNSQLVDAGDYVDYVGYVDDMKNDYYNTFKSEKLISFGASQMKVAESAEKALKDGGFGLVRAYSIGHPYGYFDKDTQLISSIGISHSDQPDINVLKSWVDNLITYGSMAVYFTHGICDDSDTTVDGSSAIRLTTFKDFIDYLVTKRNAGQLQIITMRDLWYML